MPNILVVAGAAMALLTVVIAIVTLPLCGGGESIVFLGLFVVSLGMMAAGLGAAGAAPYVAIFGFAISAIGLIVGHGAGCSF